MTNQRKGGPRPAGARGREIRTINALPRHRSALQLRSSGKTYREIADELGYADGSGAYRAIQSAMKEFIREPAQEAKDFELARLDKMLEGLWDAATNGDTRAIQTVLNIMARRAQYLGLDSPQQLTENLTVEWVNDWREQHGNL